MEEQVGLLALIVVTPLFWFLYRAAKKERVASRGPRSLNGIGTTYYGATDRQDNGTFVTTLWIIFVGIPLIPLRSYRVNFMGGDDSLTQSTHNYEIVERVPLCLRQVIAAWLKVIVIGIILVLLGILFFDYIPNHYAIKEDTSGIIGSVLILATLFIGSKFFEAQ